MNSGAKACSWIHIVGKPQQLMYFTAKAASRPMLSMLLAIALLVLIRGNIICLFEYFHKIFVI